MTLMPESDVCLACWTAYLCGQFKLQYDTIRKLKKAIDLCMQLAKEFKDCSQMVVVLVNNGDLELKARPTGKIKNALMNIRAKVVEEFKSDEILVDVNYKHVTPTRYHQMNGRTYEEDGMQLECVWANQLVTSGWVGLKVHTTYACGRVGGLERNICGWVRRRARTYRKTYKQQHHTPYDHLIISTLIYS